jgi:hypothetical protein
MHKNHINFIHFPNTYKKREDDDDDDDEEEEIKNVYFMYF